MKNRIHFFMQRLEIAPLKSGFMQVDRQERKTYLKISMNLVFLVYMKFILQKNELLWIGGRCRVAVGGGGLILQSLKREGDRSTPIGVYNFRRVLYRADRLSRPQTSLSCREIKEDDGWCDEPSDPAYNRPTHLPYKASCEKLFRKDHVYDLLVVLGHNDNPPVASMGSAIFLHLARSDYSLTRGCLAVSEFSLRQILALVDKTSTVEIGR
jgi:L,D-peptidoglycan transpeptidase YkuD (ErfK/YbiS/YcfS/YnhG family)